MPRKTLKKLKQIERGKKHHAQMKEDGRDIHKFKKDSKTAPAPKLTIPLLKERLKAAEAAAAEASKRCPTTTPP